MRILDTKPNMLPPVVPLVKFDSGAYALDPDALEWLRQRERPFAVVVGAGKFRTGKSFLLNRIADNPAGKGFGVGETVQACTRGIWLSTKPIECETHDVLVMDTEGIDALDAESQHDVRVFALAVLLCSVFIYNQMSHLDEAAVQTLSLMTRVAESVGEAGHAPTLYWVLRDFALQLVDAKGKPITHADYLEQALHPPASKCATRDAIKSLFPRRHLVTLPRPHKGETAQKIDATLKLNEKFKDYLGKFRAHLLEHSTPVAAADHTVPGTAGAVPRGAAVRGTGN